MEQSTEANCVREPNTQSRRARETRRTAAPAATPGFLRRVRSAMVGLLLLVMSACTAPEPPPPPKPTLPQLAAAYEAARARSDWATMLEVGRDMDRRFPGSKEERAFSAERADIAAKAAQVALAGVEVKPDPPPTPSKLLALDAKGQRQMLFACMSAVDSEIKRANDTPFQWIRLDDQSADVFQAAAPSGLFKSENEQLASFALQIKNSEGKWALLSFPVLEIEDSFSGPQRSVKAYDCSIEPDLSVRVSR